MPLPSHVSCVVLAGWLTAGCASTSATGPGIPAMAEKPAQARGEAGGDAAAPRGKEPRRPFVTVATYDPATAVRMSGTVFAPDALPPGARVFRGGTLQLATASGRKKVRVSKERYRRRKDFEIALGDRIRVVGRDAGGDRGIGAASIAVHGDVLELWPYDPEKVVEIEGKVAGFPMVRRTSGTGYARVRLGSEILLVQLGPRGFLEQEGVKLEAGDQIEIFGCRTVLGYWPLVLAAEVRVGERVVRLRDESGALLGLNATDPGASPHIEEKPAPFH